MKKWEKSPKELIELFNKILPDSEVIEKRQMFGYPSSFINRNMFMGLFGDQLFIRLSESDRDEFLKLDEAKLFEPMAGRPMKEYVMIPASLLKDTTTLNEWIEKSFVYTASLPPRSSMKRK